jgi:hypothetical protein
MPADDDSQSSCPHVSGMRGVCDIQPTKLRQSVKENYEELSASIVDGKTMRENAGESVPLSLSIVYGLIMRHMLRERTSSSGLTTHPVTF